MTIDQKIEAFHTLGTHISASPEAQKNCIRLSTQHNAWFTEDSVKKALEGITFMLNKTKLHKWLSEYSFTGAEPLKKVGLILAGNIPAVGFHDLLCVLMSGNVAIVKLSSQDNQLIPYLTNLLIQIEPEFENRVKFIERLENIDAVIATGSDNSARYFEHYFGKYPNIIRKNRSSIAVLTGQETSEELAELGNDIFQYYGLGCRNISKLLVPENYNFNLFFESIESFTPVGNHHKYRNNYDYNKSIYLVNKVPHLDNGFLLVTESDQFVSPISVLFYQTYKDQNEVLHLLSENKDKIQCTVTNSTEIDQRVGFGKAQQPEVWDYADNVDTLKFLSSLE